jgi:uncharacterized membrane protein YtjA (UPF0391 family)
MLRLPVILLVLTILVAYLGFSGIIGGDDASIARILFFIFIGLFAMSLFERKSSKE